MSLEENWLQYFQSTKLHSNEPLNPAQTKNLQGDARNECHGQHSRPLYFLITENKIRIKLEIS